MINRKFLIGTRKLVRNREEVRRHKNWKSWNYRIWFDIFRKNKMKPPMPKTSILMQIGGKTYRLHTISDDSIQILLKLDWIDTFTIQTNFRRVYIDSLEDNNAYTSPRICTKRLVFGGRTVFISVLSGYTNLSHNFTKLVFCDVINSLFYSHGQHPNVPTF